MKSQRLALSNLIIFVIVLIFNFLTGTGRINDLSQAEVSAMYPTKITPAGFTFSIWGIIYILLFISLFYMLFKHKEASSEEAIDTIGYLFVVSSLANILWTVSFSYLKLATSSFLIMILLLSLVLILKRFSRRKVGGLYAITFGLYAGWVTIASVVNIAATLVQKGFPGFGISENIWAALILSIAFILVILMSVSLKNIMIPLPVAWAYFGIFKAHGSYIALVIMILFLILAGVQVQRNGFKIQS